jgi:hypothetical protein
MVTFIRSPTWITPEFSESIATEGRATRFSPEEIEHFENNKKDFLEYRKMVQNTGSSNYGLFFKDSELQKKAFMNFQKMMKGRLNGNEELCKNIIPKFAVGCRRYIILLKNLPLYMTLIDILIVSLQGTDTSRLWYNQIQ